MRLRLLPKTAPEPSAIDVEGGIEGDAAITEVSATLRCNEGEDAITRVTIDDAGIDDDGMRMRRGDDDGGGAAPKKVLTPPDPSLTIGD